MRLEWLGQRFGFRVRPPVSVLPVHWKVEAYKLVSNRWVKMPEYDRSFPHSDYVGAYYDSLCLRGRSLALASSYGTFIRRIFADSPPVVVRMLGVDHLGVWTVKQECRK